MTVLNKRSKLSMGFEVELETPSGFGESLSICASNAQSLLSSLNLGIAKIDGTIHHGFEFASKPAAETEFLSDSLDSSWANLFGKFRQIKAFTDKHVGMHIHVGKETLTKEQIIKINYFVFRNPEFISLIGERTPTGYCRERENLETAVEINNQNGLYSGDYRYIVNHSAVSHNRRVNRADIVEKNTDVLDYKYRMLNVARPYTIEFRFFKSTADYNTFLKNMQFVIALARFASETNYTLDDYKIGGTRIGDCDGYLWQGGTNVMSGNFCQYVRENRDSYVELDNFLVQQNCLSEYKKKINKKKIIKRKTRKG